VPGEGNPGFLNKKGRGENTVGKKNGIKHIVGAKKKKKRKGTKLRAGRGKEASICPEKDEYQFSHRKRKERGRRASREMPSSEQKRILRKRPGKEINKTDVLLAAARKRKREW